MVALQLKTRRRSWVYISAKWIFNSQMPCLIGTVLGNMYSKFEVGACALTILEQELLAFYNQTFRGSRGKFSRGRLWTVSGTCLSDLMSVAWTVFEKVHWLNWLIRWAQTDRQTIERKHLSHLNYCLHLTEIITRPLSKLVKSCYEVYFL